VKTDERKKPFWYLAKWNGRYLHTQYPPAQTAQVQALLKAGVPRDAIAQLRGIGESSLSYVAALEHRSTVVEESDMLLDNLSACTEAP
jgi:hypothetical protein